MRSFRLNNPACPKCAQKTCAVRTPWNLLKIALEILVALAAGSCVLSLDWKCKQCGYISHQTLD